MDVSHSQLSSLVFLQTLLDTSRKQSITELVDINLSREEDSVTSLAVVDSSKTSATVFAGINSSNADQQAGKNEHLRSFTLDYPPEPGDRGEASEKEGESEARAKGGSKALGRVSLFSPSTAVKKETYQRVLRLSPLKGDENSRLGAVVTGLATSGEVVVFDASKSRPSVEDIWGRIRLEEGQEAADVDIWEDSDGGYQVAYCTDFEVYLYDISTDPKKKPSEPRFLHGTAHPDVFASSKSRPKFRSLRFLTPHLILLLQNQANRNGAELLLLDVRKSISLGTVILHKRLHKSIRSATGLTTAYLSPATDTHNVQNVIAVAGQDISITVFTLDHSPYQRSSQSLKFRTHCILRDVHPLQITALTFSAFALPQTLTAPPPQYLKLASVSVGSTVVVHTFPLTPYPPSSRSSNAKSRYVLSVPGTGETAQVGFSVLVSIIMVALGAFLLQAWTEIRGGTPEYLGAKGWLSQSVHNYIARPYMFENLTEMAATPTRMPDLEGVRSSVPSMEEVKEKIPNVEEIKQQMPSIQQLSNHVPNTEEMKEEIPSVNEMRDSVHDAAENIKKSTSHLQQKLNLRSLLSLHPHSASNLDNNPSRKAIMVRDTGTSLSADVHDHSTTVLKEAKRWEELNEREREGWKQKLMDAGEWMAEEGEAVLKGVFFSQLAAVVGAEVGGE